MYVVCSKATAILLDCPQSRTLVSVYGQRVYSYQLREGLHLLVNIILQYDFLNDFYTKNYTYSYLQKSFLIFGISRIFLGDDATLLLVFLEHDLGSSKNGVVGPNSIGE